MRATHPALWIDISEVQRELNRNLRRVKVVPHSFERGHPFGEPCRGIGFRHRGAVRFHPCSLAAIRTAGGSPRADAFGFQVSEEEARTAVLAALGAVAARVYVPASESSRAKGAGGGSVDDE